MVAIKDAGPGRLEIREGGGCLTLFGLPFFGTGIFMVLASFGVVTMRSDGAAVTQAAALGLGALFTFVGGVLAFGRSVTSIGSARRHRPRHPRGQHAWRARYRTRVAASASPSRCGRSLHW